MRVLPYELSQTRECFQSGEPISDLSVASVGISPRDVAQVRTRRALLTTYFPPVLFPLRKQEYTRNYQYLI